MTNPGPPINNKPAEKQQGLHTTLYYGGFRKSYRTVINPWHNLKAAQCCRKTELNIYTVPVIGRNKHFC